MAETYMDEIKAKVQEIVGPSIPIFTIGSPPATAVPATFGSVSFSMPTHVKRGSGIVSVQQDVHMVMCSVRIDSEDADIAQNTMLDIFWGLNGFKPTNCGELTSSVSGSWGRLEGQAQPHIFSQATIFYFNTNLESR